jgi:Fur family transcriptional regulator, peroxide stress response regulator
MQKLESVIDSLRKEGFRITPQRVAIVNYVLGTDSHPSAEELHSAVCKVHPMVSLATVYKTLELLKKKGLVHELDFPTGARYDSNVNPHINLVCMKCGRIDDIDDALIGEIESRIGKKTRYSILGSRFELYGYCSKCQSRTK